MIATHKADSDYEETIIMEELRRDRTARSLL